MCMKQLAPVVFVVFAACVCVPCTSPAGEKNNAQPQNRTKPVDRAGLPYRVHVVEDYETGIERRWWLAGKEETKDLPPSRSPHLANRRCCRATLTRDFDRKMGDQSLRYKAVIFNPVPGPPMGSRTRLSFRYKLQGTDRLKVQIYSLTNGYHRHAWLTGLPRDKWQAATVDMTAARRPDGSGGPLSADERIDDIQFYIDPRSELLIDDIVLYDEAAAGEKRPFPRRPIFTGWFDTGKQGQEWPGDFEIVLHEKPLTWDAARSVKNRQTGRPWIRVSMRGPRPLGRRTQLRFRYRVKGARAMEVVLVSSKSNRRWTATAENLVEGKWTETTLSFDTAPPADKDTPPRPLDPVPVADEIHFLLPAGAELWADDLLLLEP